MIKFLRMYYHDTVCEFHAFVYFCIGSEYSKEMYNEHYEKYCKLKRKP